MHLKLKTQVSRAAQAAEQWLEVQRVCSNEVMMYVNSATMTALMEVLNLACEQNAHLGYLGCPHEWGIAVTAVYKHWPLKPRHQHVAAFDIQIIQSGLRSWAGA